MPIDPVPTHLTKTLKSLESSRTNRRLLESPKPGSSRELFLPENSFKTCYTVYFPKNIQIWEAWKSMEDMKIRLDFYLKRPT